MIFPEIIQRVKELEIHTRRLLSGSNVGQIKSKQKGFGFEFDQLRTYQYGDDVRLIDWNSTAKSANNTILVRQYHEERNRTFIICLDISPSTFFGSMLHLKQDVMKQIAGVLSLAGQYSKDKVGLILFSDQIELVIPPARGEKHVQGLLIKLFSHKATGKKTDFNVLFDYVAARVAKRSILFVISDFIGDDIAKSIKKVTCDKEVVAICCYDKQVRQMASVGLVWMKDIETGDMILVNTRNTKSLNATLQQRLQEQKLMLQKNRIDMLHVALQGHFMHDLIIFFQKRMIY